MRVHILHQCARRSSFHLVYRDVTPSAVVLFQVRFKEFDLKQLICELFWSQIVVADVVSNGFLRYVFLVSIELRSKESGNTFYCCVYHRSHFLFNNNKHNLYYNYILKFYKHSLWILPNNSKISYNSSNNSNNLSKTS